MQTLVKVENLTKNFIVRKKILTAIRSINLEIYRGETLGIVGESGSGKSTLGKTILRLYEPSAGKVILNEVDITMLSQKELQEKRQKMQIIFQDPHSSLNPRMTIEKILSEPLQIHKLMERSKQTDRVKELLSLVGLPTHFLNKYPHECSGGQCQRIGIARALAVEPEFIVCDEPLSALDLSTQAQVVNLLRDLQKQMEITYLFISHDLTMMRYIADRVAVMYLGEIVEIGSSNEIYNNPKHPYTQALLSSILIPNPEIEKRRSRIILKGEPPNPLFPPKGCSFAPRCPKANAGCHEKAPSLVEGAPAHFTACHLYSSL